MTSFDCLCFDGGFVKTLTVVLCVLFRRYNSSSLQASLQPIHRAKHGGLQLS